MGTQLWWEGKSFVIDCLALCLKCIWVGYCDTLIKMGTIENKQTERRRRTKWRLKMWELQDQNSSMAHLALLHHPTFRGLRLTSFVRSFSVVCCCSNRIAAARIFVTIPNDLWETQWDQTQNPWRAKQIPLLIANCSNRVSLPSRRLRFSSNFGKQQSSVALHMQPDTPEVTFVSLI